LYVNGNLGTVLSNNLVVANSANVAGGGIYLYSTGASAYDNVVVGNIGGGAGGGLAVGSPSVPVNITNNTFVGNVLTVHTVPKGATYSSVGGGIYSSFLLSQQSNPLTHLTNNLMAQNDVTTTGGGGGLFSYRAFATNDHNDFYGDRPNEIRGDYSDGNIIGSNGNVNLNPVFTNAPTFWDYTNTAGTASTVVVFDSSRYAVGNKIEYNNDGFSRQITSINSSTKTLTFTPALTNKVCSNAINAACTVNGDCLSPGTCGTDLTRASRIVANWGGGTNMNEDFRLTASSPLREAGTDAPLFGTVPPADADDLPRPADGDLNGSILSDIGAYEFRFPDSDGDGWPDPIDCSPLVNSVWAVPDQAPDPLAIDSSQTLFWLHIPQSNVYNVYSGTITVPFTYTPACLQAEVPGVRASLAGGDPPLGTAYYYLVGGVNTCGSGPIHQVPSVYPSPVCVPSGADTDGDGVANVNDNCPTVYNPSQLDANANGVGDACE